MAIAVAVGVVACSSEREPARAIGGFRAASVLSGPPPLTNATSATFDFSSDQGGAATFECQLDGSGFVACAAPQTYTGLSDGAHTFDVRDVIGGVPDPTPASLSWTIDSTAPDTSILSGPSGTVTSDVADFSFSSTEAPATFECSLDGNPYQGCTSPTQYTGLSDGPHTFLVRSIDAAMNVDITHASASWTVDTTAPNTTIVSGPALLTNSTQADFDFSASEGSVTYQCRLDGGVLAPCSDPISFMGLLEGAHVLEVQAVDVNGNADPTPATYSWSIDITPPDTTIGVTPPALSGSASATFTFDGSEPPQTFQCRVDGGAFAPCTSPVNLTGLAEGSHSFDVRATDLAGNTDSTPATFNWTVDTVAPNTSFTSTPPAVSTSTSATFVIASTESPATFQCSFDGAPFSTCTSPAIFTGLVDGTYNFRAYATDAAGNDDSASPASFTFTVDNTVPDTVIDVAPAALTNSSTASFQFGSPEGGVTFECSLDSAAYAPCLASSSFPGLADGSHTLDVRAVDGAGNKDASPANHSWTVDTTAPNTSVTSSPPLLTTAANATFAFSSTEPGTFECRIDGGAYAACASPMSFTGLSDGAHTFDVRAIDTATNTDPTPASYAWTVDNTQPDTFILSGPSLFSNSTTATFDLDASELGVSYECAVDGGSYAPCADPAVLTTLSEALHIFRARATDGAGNVDSSAAVYSWTVDVTAPTVTILSGPAAVGNQAAVDFTFDSNDPAVGFECNLDGGGYLACNAAETFGPLADGAHQLQVRAVDPAGNASGPELYTFTIDTAAPDTTLDGSPASPSQSDTGVFSFSSPEPLATFECSFDGGLYAPCTSPSSYVGVPEGTHTFTVRALDGAGNVDPSPAFASWVIDLTAPDTSITASPNLVTNATTAIFSFTASEVGATFQCAMDSGPFVACTSGQSFPGLSEGLHLFRVRAVDAVGQEDTSPAFYSWTVDTTPPDTSIVSSPTDPSNSSVGNFDFDSADPTVTYECRVDGIGGFLACSDPAAFSGLLDGPHGVEVRAVDAAGNADPSPATFFWNVDLVPPDTSILSGPPALANSSNATFTFSGSEFGSTFECRTDGAAFAVCASPATLTALGDGVHTFDVRAVDPAGNRDTTPATYTWTVDVTAPDTQILSNPGASTNLTSATFTFGASETPVTFQCALDGSAFGPCTSPVTYSGLAVGPHDFAVRASDAFSTDATPATFNWVIDQTAPDTSFGSTPSNPSNVNPPVFVLNSTESGTFECQLDGGGFSPCAALPSLGSLADGSHTFDARAVDAAGNVDASPATFTWMVDTTPPNTTANIANYTTTSSASIVLGATESPVTYECALDGGAYATCTAPALYTGLADGLHSILVRAKDQAGNVDPTPASDSWTQDTVPPNTTIDVGPLVTDPDPNPQFQFSSNEPGTFECSLVLSPAPPSYAPCASPQDYFSLANGTYTFTVRAVDLAGNADATPATRSWTVGVDPDSDGDGIPDSVETLVTLTLPGDDDTDNDGILDGNEDKNANGVLDAGETSPTNPDTDGDGIQDGTELGLTAPQGNGTVPLSAFVADLDPVTVTNPRLTDSDGGGVFDGIEDANFNGRLDPGETDPTNPNDDFDADFDGIDDATEILAGTDPNDSDSDDDGVPDGLDGLTDNDLDGVIDALDPDSDNDGILDGTESGVVAATAPPGTNLTSPNFVPDRDAVTRTNPKLRDTDGDGLSDGEEDKNRNGRVDPGETNPLARDTDGDGLSDFLELRANNPTNPTLADTDGDGLNDGVEDANRNGRVDAGETDPTKADTDGDGISDGVEVANGTDPLDVVDGLEVSGGGCSKSSGSRRAADVGWGMVLAWWLWARRRRLARASRPTVLPLVAILTFAVLAAPEARAEVASRSIDLHRLRLGAGEGDVFGVLGIPTTPWRKFRGGVYVGYASDLLSFQTAGGGQTLFRPIESHKSIDLMGSYGVTDRSDVSLAIAAIAQSTNVPAALSGVYPNGIAGSGIGDARVNLKYRLSELTANWRFGLAMGVVLPTGNGQAYLGSGSFTFQPRLLSEYLFANGTRLVGNLGVDLRPERQLLNLTVGSELVMGVGASIPVRRLGKATRVLVDAVGAVGLSSQASAAVPFELRAGMSFRLRPHMGLQFGYGRGLTGGYGTPAWRAFLGVTFGESTSPITDGYERRSVRPATPAAPAPPVAPTTPNAPAPPAASSSR